MQELVIYLLLLFPAPKHWEPDVLQPDSILYNRLDEMFYIVSTTDLRTRMYTLKPISSESYIHASANWVYVMDLVHVNMNWEIVVPYYKGDLKCLE